MPDKLKPDTILTAWLYRVAYRTAIDVVRRESRRQDRKQKALEMPPAILLATRLRRFRMVVRERTKGMRLRCGEGNGFPIQPRPRLSIPPFSWWPRGTDRRQNNTTQGIT
jgi:hypothetical protein